MTRTIYTRRCFLRSPHLVPCGRLDLKSPIFRCRSTLKEESILERLRKTRNVVRCLDKLLPYDPDTFNAALLLWNAIADVPAERRIDLLDYFNISDIKRLWQISAQRYDAKRESSTYMRTYSPFEDLPTEPGQVVAFEGKMATKTAMMGWDRFSKEMMMDEETFVVCGRMRIHNIPLPDILYPLYFRTDVGEERIPANGDASEMQIRFMTETEMAQSLTKIPRSWPHPRDPAFPFHGGLTTYCRPIGPGCYVGIGWREPRLEFGDIGRRFLTCLLIKSFKQK